MNNRRKLEFPFTHHLNFICSLERRMGREKRGVDTVESDELRAPRKFCDGGGV